MSKYLGVHITNVELASFTELRVTFESAHQMIHQIYVGRTLAGVTSTTTQREVVIQYFPEVTPSPLQMIALTSDEDYVEDNGALLPGRPYNLHTAHWTAASLAADTDRFVVTGPDAEGGSPVATNILGAVPHTGDGSYDFDLPALESSGSWQFGITGYDDVCGADLLNQGNAGTVGTLTIDADVYPPDMTEQSDGKRFGVTVAAGTATVEVIHP